MDISATHEDRNVPRKTMRNISSKPAGDKRKHPRPTINSAKAAVRFKTVQKAILSAQLKIEHPGARLAASLVMFDAVVTDVDLAGAIANARGIYRWQDNACLDWSDPDGRQNRRFLSIFTRLTLGASCSRVASSEAISELDKALNAFNAGSADRYGLEQFLVDARAWLFEHVDGPIYAHCVRSDALTALPRSTLARESSRLRLSTVDSNESIERVSSDVGLGQALAGFFTSKGRDKGTWLVDAIVAAAKGGRREMLKAFLKLAPAAANAGPISSVILAWSIDLAESGTRTKVDARDKTIAGYIKDGAPKIYQSFAGKDLEALARKEFQETYEGIISKTSPGKKKGYATALHSFHYFLTCWTPVAPIRSLYQNLPADIPRANVLWPHEINLIGTWLTVAQEDERFIEQTRVAFAISAKIRIRAKELLNLRLNNILIFGDTIEVEIATLPQDGGLKSKAARRHQKIDDPATVSLIAGWVKRRKSRDHALPTDLLFGDPHTRKGYRVGEMYVLLNRLMKIATGDPRVSLHTLSHTWASTSLHAAMLGESTADLNPYEVIATGGGHESSRTTFVHYFHLFELPLRRMLDRAIAETLTWPSVRALLSISHDHYRQRCSRMCKKRSAANSGEATMLLLEEEAKKHRQMFPDASTGFAMEAPVCPTNLGVRAPLKLQDVVDIVADIQAGIEIDAISSRCARPPELILATARSGLSTLGNLLEFDPRSSQRRVGDDVANLHSLLKGAIGERIALDDIDQEKLKPLYSFLKDASENERIAAGLRSWEGCYRKGYISLAEPGRASGLVALLEAASVPRDRLVIRRAKRDEATVRSDIERKIDDQLEHARISSIFGSCGSGQPVWDSVEFRRGRPSTHLILSSVGAVVGRDMPSAAVSMGGFNGLLFAATIFLALGGYGAQTPIAVDSDKGKGE